MRTRPVETLGPPIWFLRINHPAIFDIECGNEKTTNDGSNHSTGRRDQESAVKSLLLFTIGLLSILGPAICFAMQIKDHDDADLETWLSKLTLNQILTLQGMILAGMLMLNASVMLK